LFNIERHHKALFLTRRIARRRFYLPGEVILLWASFERKYIPSYNEITFPSRLFLKVIKNGEVTIRKCIQDHIILTEIYSTGLWLFSILRKEELEASFRNQFISRERKSLCRRLIGENDYNLDDIRNINVNAVIYNIFQLCNTHARYKF
jgi:hypothetical protein